MSGLLYVAKRPKIVASSASLNLEFNSGGDVFRFMLSREAGIAFRHAMQKEAWPVLCAPDADVIPLWAGCKGCDRLADAREK